MKAAVVTAGRSDRGLLDILMAEMRRHGMPFCTIGVGEATDADYVVDSLLVNDSPRAVAKSAGLVLHGIPDAYALARPDVVVVLGDRYETLAAVQAAHLMRIPIAHIHGGERTTGSLDDRMRDAISMLATVHFAAHKEYADRLVAMGVQGAVYDTGALALDDLRINAREPDGFFDEQRPMVLVSVPEGLEVAEAIDAALQRVAYRTCFWLPPNADAGRTALSMYANTESLSRERYLQFLAAADVAVGNSSSLIYEAHAVGTPAVLVGDRQEGRVLPDSVVRVAVDPPAIAAAIVAAMESEVGRTSPFGDGHAAERMVSVLCAL